MVLHGYVSEYTRAGVGFILPYAAVQFWGWVVCGWRGRPLPPLIVLGGTGAIVHHRRIGPPGPRPAHHWHRTIVSRETQLMVMVQCNIARWPCGLPYAVP